MFVIDMLTWQTDEPDEMIYMVSNIWPNVLISLIAYLYVVIGTVQYTLMAIISLSSTIMLGPKRGDWGHEVCYWTIYCSLVVGNSSNIIWRYYKISFSANSFVNIWDVKDNTKNITLDNFGGLTTFEGVWDKQLVLL